MRTSAGAKRESWELMEGDCHSKAGYSKLQQLPVCLLINTQNAPGSVNNLHAVYHVLFGSENKAGVVDSLTLLNLIRILMLIWQHHVAEVTSDFSGNICVVRLKQRLRVGGEPWHTRLAEPAPGSVQPALLRISSSCIDLKETKSHFFLFTYLASSSSALCKAKMMRGNIRVLSGKKRCRVAEMLLCTLRQTEH